LLRTSSSYSGGSNLAKGKSSISVLLRIDNTNAVVYSVFNTLAKIPWAQCMERNVISGTYHLQGVINSTADTESKAWLDRKVTQDIPENQFSFESPVIVPIFPINSHECQLEARLSHNGNAFTIIWPDFALKIYTNPPWNPISRVLLQACSHAEHPRTHPDSSRMEHLNLLSFAI